MTSVDLEPWGFDEWWVFQRDGWSFVAPDSGSIVLKAVPPAPGVYVIRQAAYTFGRWRGESDIVYIGCARNGRGLRGRFAQYLGPNPTGTTWRVMEATFGGDAPYDVSWVVTSAQRARDLEAKLLYRYQADHDELPPLNLRVG